MEYTNNEKQILSFMEKANFKNLPKHDIITFVSKIAELRPEVAKEILAQFPEFVGLVKTILTEYKEALDTIVASDDESLKAYYSIANKEMDSAIDSRKQFYDLVKLVQEDYSKCLNNPNLSPEIIIEILNRQSELVRMAIEKDAEIREQEKEIEDKVNKKDTEKRELNWKLLGGISLALIAVVGINAGVLGGKIDIKLPKTNL